MLGDPSISFSNLSTVGDKINVAQVREKITDGVQNVSQAAEKGAENVSLRFKSLFNSKKAIETPSRFSPDDLNKPTKKKFQALQGFNSSLFYPTEMKYFTKFQFYTYEREAAQDEKSKILREAIFLPIPSNLAENYDVQYDMPALGVMTGSAESLIAKIREGSRDEGVIGSIKNIASGLTGEKVLRTGADALAAASMQTLGAEGIGGALRKQLRAAPNPFVATIFNSVSLRTHTFTYRFAPNSESELKRLKQIIRTFKRALLPDEGVFADNAALLLTFPDECEIEFGPTPGKPYTILPCFLTSLNVNYAPDNTPAFFKTGDPVAVEIQLSFREKQALTRKDLRKIEEIEKRAEEGSKATQTVQTVSNGTARTISGPASDSAYLGGV